MIKVKMGKERDSSEILEDSILSMILLIDLEEAYIQLLSWHDF